MAVVDDAAATFLAGLDRLGDVLELLLMPPQHRAPRPPWRRRVGTVLAAGILACLAVVLGGVVADIAVGGLGLTGPLTWSLLAACVMAVLLGAHLAVDP